MSQMRSGPTLNWSNMGFGRYEGEEGVDFVQLGEKGYVEVFLKNYFL